MTCPRPARGPWARFMNLIHGYTGHLLSTSTSVKDSTLTGVLVKTDEEIRQWGPHDLSIYCAAFMCSFGQ